MNKMRSWVGGLSISAPCVFFTLAMTPGLDLSSSGPVHGRITYNGRPLEGGFILFEPAERQSSVWALGPIERDGSYSVDAKWQRVKHGRERFRICVVPKEVPPVDQMPSQSRAANPEVVLMSLGYEKRDSCESKAVEHRLPARFTNVWTSGLQVTLGSEPARVDIDLKD